MPVSLDDLTPGQRRPMARLVVMLDRSDVDLDTVGRELEELSDTELIDAYELIPLGLVEIAPGWRGTHWFVLSGARRRMPKARRAERGTPRCVPECF